MAFDHGADATGLGGALLSFVPRFIVTEAAAHPDEALQPRQLVVDAALLQCDLSGFTPLTERLAQLGPEGVEELSQSLSSIFGSLTDVVASHGGDVVKFAGDALTVWWQLDPDDGTDARSVAVRRAAHCAFDMQDALRSHEVAVAHSLAMRAGISVGEVTVMHIGGLRDRWGVALIGDAVTEVGAAQTESSLGEVALGPLAVAQLEELLGDVEPTGTIDVRRDQIVGTPPPRIERPVVPVEAEARLKPYVASAVKERLAAGQSDWIGELRRLSVVFIDLPDLTAGPSLDDAQAMLADLQEVLYRYEGSFDKLSIDEKGIKLVGVFGLPPFSHEDDPIRAVLAALEISRRFRLAGRRCSIGVSTGQAFCGVLGSDSRRDYTVMGDMVNLGARLMQAAQGGILCNEDTYEAGQVRVAFRASRPISLKGKSEPVVAYSPTGEHEPTHATPVVSARGQSTPMVGRDAEARQLSEMLAALVDGKSEALVLAGEAGIGKSRLIEHVLDEARRSGVVSLVGAGDAIEAATPYRAWRRILSEILQLDRVPADPDLRRRHVVDFIGGDGELQPLIPLLNTILPLNFEETELTLAMDADVRADNIQRLVSRLIQGVAVEQPVLLVIDDAHWIDSSSWLLLRDLISGVRPLAAIAATRPIDEPLPPEYQSFLTTCAPTVVTLGPLPDESIAQLVSDTLGVESLPTEVLEVLRTRTEGHPFFSRELAFFLRNEGIILVDHSGPGGRPAGRIAPGADLDEVVFPASVQVVVTSRIDRLETTQQLLLKVASVFGRVFSEAALLAVLPVDSDVGRFNADLKQLVTADFIALDTPEPRATYAFSHAIIQEVAYGLLLFAQRRELHRAVALWHESAHSEDLDRYLPLLAHHWLKTDDVDQAIHYQSLAGEQALGNFANEEAIKFLSTALQVSAAAGRELDPIVNARWELQMGDAQVYWSRYEEGRQHLERGLALLDHPVPAASSLASWAFPLARAILPQVLRRARPARRRASEPGKRVQLLLASRAYTRLVETAFLSGDQWLALYSAFHALNLAEATEPSSELAEAYGPVGVIWGAIPWRSKAERYVNRAIETARLVDDSTALAYALITGAVLAIGNGDWETAGPRISELVELGRHMGAGKRTNDGLHLRTIMAYTQGRFEDCREVAEELVASASRGHDPRFLAYGLYAKAYSALYLGNAEEALDVISAIPGLLSAESETTDRQLELMYFALLSVIQLRLGRSDDALESAENARRLQVGASLDIGYTLPGYSLPAEVLLSLWRAGHPDDRLPDSARSACIALKRFARTYPLARADAALCQGLLASLRGKPHRAMAHLQSAVQTANESGLTFTAGLGHLELARMDDGTDEPNEHAQAAYEVFDELHASAELHDAAGLMRGERR